MALERYADGVYMLQEETKRRAGARIVVTSGVPKLEHSIDFSGWYPVHRRGHGVDEVNRALQDVVLAAFAAGRDASRVEALEAENKMLLGARHDPADVRRIKELEAAIRAKCAYCRESWDAGLDDPAFCPTNCPLLPYRGGE